MLDHTVFDNDYSDSRMRWIFDSYDDAVLISRVRDRKVIWLRQHLADDKPAFNHMLEVW
jgi:hypothetical protein